MKVTRLKRLRLRHSYLKRDSKRLLIKVGRDFIQNLSNIYYTIGPAVYTSCEFANMFFLL